jgi:hypothetical protein
MVSIAVLVVTGALIVWRIVTVTASVTTAETVKVKVSSATSVCVPKRSVIVTDPLTGTVMRFGLLSVIRTSDVTVIVGSTASNLKCVIVEPSASTTLTFCPTLGLTVIVVARTAEVTVTTGAVTVTWPSLLTCVTVEE